MGNFRSNNKILRLHIASLSTLVINTFKQLTPLIGHYLYLEKNCSKLIPKESASQVIGLVGYEGYTAGHNSDIHCQQFCISKDLIVSGLKYNSLLLIEMLLEGLTAMPNMLK